MGEEITLQDVQIIQGGTLQIDIYFEEQKKGGRFFCDPNEFFRKLGMSMQKNADKWNEDHAKENGLIPEKKFNIIVNTEPKEWHRSEIEYEEIIDLANVAQDFTYTVTWLRENEGLGGTLTKGQMLNVNSGMIINVSLTNNA